MREPQIPPFDEWTVPSMTLDRREFTSGRLGALSLGRVLRKSALGEVALALPDDSGPLVEVEVLDALTGRLDDDALDKLACDLSAASRLRHPHIAPMIGVGLNDDTPYVVRPHRLGRTLAELIDESPDPPVSAVVALFYSIADAVAFLAREGPSSGSCALGGFDARDVFLGFDGTVNLTGIGLRHVRGNEPEDPIELDWTSLVALADDIEAKTHVALPLRLSWYSSAQAIVRALRQRSPDACAARRQHLGALLRGVFSAAIAEERQAYGLPTLH